MRILILFFCRLLALFVIMLPGSVLAGLSDEEAEASRLLLTGGKDNQIRRCFDWASEMNEGLVAMDLSKSQDKDVAQLLLAGALPEHQELRKTQVRMWMESHKPSKLANYQYEWCVQNKGADYSAGELGDRCFMLLQVPATMFMMKSTGFGKQKVLNYSINAWKEKISEPWLQNLIDEVYSVAEREGKMIIYRRIFSGCLVANNKN